MGAPGHLQDTPSAGVLRGPNPPCRRGGLGLAYFGLADFGRFLTRLRVGPANVLHRTWSPEAGQLLPGPGGYSGVMEHPSGRSLARHAHKRYDHGQCGMPEWGLRLRFYS